VLVSGYSGVGKSSVVNELHKVLVQPRGLFAAGKFDQYKRDVPYATLAQAMRTLVRQILVKSEAEVAQWRSALTEALAMAYDYDAHEYEAEMHRLKGELLLRRDDSNAAEAEDCFLRAIEIARNWSAKSWELRATTSLARLLNRPDRRDEACRKLAVIYDWFTEGFDTADLKDAKALLHELST